MFKWPDPPDGQVYIKAPLIIYFAVSTVLAGLTGVFMRYYNEEDLHNAEKWINKKLAIIESYFRPSPPQDPKHPPPHDPKHPPPQDPKPPPPATIPPADPVPHADSVPPPGPVPPPGSTSNRQVQNQQPQNQPAQVVPTSKQNQQGQEKPAGPEATSSGRLEKDIIQESRPVAPKEADSNLTHKNGPFGALLRWRNGVAPKDPER